MKFLILVTLSVLAVSCGNPHVSSKEPPQQMVSPIQPEDETGACGDQHQQQQQQQQQQEQYELLGETAVKNFKKCDDKDVTLEQEADKANWKFDKPVAVWGTKMPFNEKSELELFDCKDASLKKFDLNGNEKSIGYSAINSEVCSVSLSKK
jgi:hypothetical protein